MGRISDAGLAARAVDRARIVDETEALALQRRLVYFEGRGLPRDPFVRQQIAAYRELLASWHGSSTKRSKKKASRETKI
jgi:hypothetical protein